jgi:hypothetical protein
MVIFTGILLPARRGNGYIYKYSTLTPLKGGKLHLTGDEMVINKYSNTYKGPRYYLKTSYDKYNTEKLCKC